MKKKYIEITVTALVPKDATDADITDWVDVTFGECGRMATDNPCDKDYEIEQASWLPD